MKLRLPKSLLVAVLASCIVSSSWAYTLQSGEQTIQSEQTISESNQVNGNVTVNGYGWHDTAGNTLNVIDGADVDINGNFYIVSQCHLNISGGSVDVTGQLSIGHSQAGNPADLYMSDGSLTVDGFILNGNHANKLQVSGGILTVTGETAISDGSSGKSSVIIGGSGEEYVTLKTGSSDVTFSYAGAEYRNLVFAEDNQGTVTINGGKISGTLVNNGDAGKVVLSGNLTISDDCYSFNEGLTEENGVATRQMTVTVGNVTIAENLVVNSKYTATMSAYYVNQDAVFSATTMTAPNIIVANGATLDVHGTAVAGKTIILQSGTTLTNTGASIGENLQQTGRIWLEGDATINSESGMMMISSSYTESVLDLYGYTLSKTGDSTLRLVNTTITDGKIDIQGGEIELHQRDGHTPGMTVGSGVIFNIATGKNLTFTSAYTGKEPGEVIANATGTGYININGNTLLEGSTSGTARNISFAGTVNVNSGQFYLGSDTDGTQYGWKLNAASMNINLNGGNLYFFGKDSSFGNISVSQNATYTMHATEGIYINHKELSIAEGKKLTIHSNWTSRANFTALSGKGNLELDNSNIGVHIGSVNMEGNITVQSKASLQIDSIASVGGITNNGSLIIGSDSESSVILANTVSNGGSIEIKSATVALGNDILKYALKTEGNITYSIEDGYGFKIYTGRELYLVKGGTVTLAEGARVQFGDETFVLDNTDGSGAYFTYDSTITDYSTFYITRGTHQASKLQNQGAPIKLASTDATLVIDQSTVNGVTAAQILTSTTGSGNITIATNVNLSAGAVTQATGELTIQNSKLEMVNERDSVYNLTSFNSIVLDKGSIKIKADAGTFNNVTVTENGGKFDFNDINEPTRPYVLSGLTTLNGDLTLETSLWRTQTTIEQLAGKGNLIVKHAYGASNENDNTIINVSSLNNYSGNLLVESVANKGKTALNITLTGNQSFGSVTLKGGAELNILSSGASRTTNITTLVLDGAGTLASTQNSACHQGVFNIGSISQIGDNAVLTLRNGSQTSRTTVFNLNGGSVTGEIRLATNSDTGGDRNISVNLNTADVAKNAVIVFDANHEKYYANLGMSTDTKVAGLSGTTTNAANVYGYQIATSGTADHIKDPNDKGEGPRNLEISVAKNKEYSTNANIDSTVNLIKSGEGKQSISGNVNSTSISVKGGELALLKESVSLNIATLNLEAGTLSVGSVEALGSVVIQGNDTSKGIAKFGASTVLNGNLTLQSGSTLELSGFNDTAASLMGSLTLDTGLVLDGEVLTQVKALAYGESLDIFHGVSDLVLLNQESPVLTLDTDALAGVDASLYFTNLADGIYTITFENNTVSIHSSVPEPTTATLSLLALAALAARRRRK